MRIIRKWAGNAPAWFCIEIAIFIFYIVSMLILMIKSRFIQVGIDQSYQFEDVYMCKLITRICKSINFDIHQKSRTFDETR